jgi:hypothetical protein
MTNFLENPDVLRVASEFPDIHVSQLTCVLLSDEPAKLFFRDFNEEVAAVAKASRIPEWTRGSCLT